jgi:hypothetical protein
MVLRRILLAGAPIALVLAGLAAVSQYRTKSDVIVSIQQLAAERVEASSHRAHVSRPPPPPRKGAFLSLTGIGDDEMVSEGFTLAGPLDVRILGVGEGMGGEMYDFGWITNALTRQVVWRMDLEHTEHAGGADKNRVVDDVVTLEPGDYMVYYVTDGSHSWSNWNATAPADENVWGITLLAPEGADASQLVTAYEFPSDPAIVAHLIGIRDNEQRSQRFTLADASKIRVYALGEGSGGDMYDHAWIEDAATGRAVWEMTYRTTEHAGGGDKNRLFDGIIGLEAGEYVLRYESDGSHSFEGWNTTAPSDPFNYGVTLFRVER